MTEEELMLTTVKNCRRTDLYVDKKPLSPNEQNLLIEMRQRRQSGEPLQYVIGHCEFMNVKLLVNEFVLIPRPETEILAEFVVGTIKSLKLKSPRILDIGTGCGNIALSLAKNISNCIIIGVDISKDAIDLARENALVNDLKGSIEFIQSDLFLELYDLSDKKRRFDIIVSNPPYIPTDQIANLPFDVQKEPKIALDGGCDGLDFYRRIASESPNFLNKGGLIFIEIGDGQKDEIEEIFNRIGLFAVKKTLKDYLQTERVLMLQLL